MTTNKITTEEKRLWLEQFSIFPQYKESKKRIDNLSKNIAEKLNNSDDECENSDLIEMSNQLFNAHSRNLRLTLRMATNYSNLIQFNPNFRLN